MDVEYLIPKSKQKFVENGYRTYSKKTGTSKQTDVTPNNKTK
jgi:hypothetical protein